MSGHATRKVVTPRPNYGIFQGGNRKRQQEQERAREQAMQKAWDHYATNDFPGEHGLIPLSADFKAGFEQGAKWEKETE